MKQIITPGTSEHISGILEKPQLRLVSPAETKESSQQSEVPPTIEEAIAAKVDFPTMWDAYDSLSDQIKEDPSLSDDQRRTLESDLSRRRAIDALQMKRERTKILRSAVEGLLDAPVAEINQNLGTLYRAYQENLKNHEYDEADELRVAGEMLLDLKRGSLEKIIGQSAVQKEVIDPEAEQYFYFDTTTGEVTRYPKPALVG